MSLLAEDPRTMWAWAEYSDDPLDVQVTHEMAEQILESIPSGDHVEVFGAVVITKRDIFLDDGQIPRRARFAARTFGAWIIPSPGGQPRVIAASTTEYGGTESAVYQHWPSLSDFAMADGRKLYAYAFQPSGERFGEGAGRDILRLPHSPLTPPPLGSEAGVVLVPSNRHHSGIRLLGDWQTAESIAQWHMSGPLGLVDARMTGGVSDRGVDVEHPEAVAQVKMQATAVGAPLIRQLRGARPRLHIHVFYSTSGYTRAAKQEAAETGVALFSIGEDASVRPVGTRAEDLIIDGYRRQGGDDARVAEYMREVTARVQRAHENFGSDESRALLQAKNESDFFSRAERYLEGALFDVEREFPRIGAVAHRTVVAHFRNADLKAAFFCGQLNLPYPGSGPHAEPSKPRSAADFY